MPPNTGLITVEWDVLWSLAKAGGLFSLVLILIVLVFIFVVKPLVQQKSVKNEEPVGSFVHRPCGTACATDVLSPWRIEVTDRLARIENSSSKLENWVTSISDELRSYRSQVDIASKEVTSFAITQDQAMRGLKKSLDNLSQAMVDMVNTASETVEKVSKK